MPINKDALDEEFEAMWNNRAKTAPAQLDGVDAEFEAMWAAAHPTAAPRAVTPAAPPVDSSDPLAVEKFKEMLANPQEYARIKRWAGYLGTTPEDPIVQRRLTNPLNFSTYSTLLQLKTTGNLDEVNDMTPEGNVAGTGLRAALMQFGHAGGIFRRRNDALVSRIAAGQEMELGGTIRQYKKIEDMTRAEQDATVPKEIIDLVNQYDTPEAPLDARTRAEAIYTAAKSSATAREQTMEMAAEELALREELTGKTGGFLERAGVLAAKGMPTVGYGQTFLVGSALTGGVAGAAGLAAGGVKLAATIGSGVLGGVVAGADKTSELLTADINPDTGEVDKQGTDYDDARLRGYSYGAFESATEIATGKVLGVAFKGLDKVTGGYVGKTLSKGADEAARQMAKTSIGRGVAELAKGIQRIAGLQALENPLTEGLEEGIQQWGDAVFAQRPSDTETPVYAKNVFNEATGEMEQVKVEPGSDEERTAKRMLARYGDKSGYAEVGTRQMMIGEKTKEFGKEFFTWDNMVALAEGFALQYALTLGTGAAHAVKSKKSRVLVENALMAAGFTNADIIRMTDEQKAEAFDGFYGKEANREEFAKVFKDAGEMLSMSAQRAIDSELFMRTGDAIKPNFKTDIAKGVEGGAATLDDEKSGLSVDYTSTLEGTAFTVRDRDGVLAPMIFNTAEEAQKGAEKMSQLKQGRQVHMEKRAEIATRVAQVFAPGRNVILVHTDKDMKAAATENGSNPAKYVPGKPGLTAPNGALIINVAANTSFDELVKTVKHETGHSVADEAGLTKLIEGKTLDGIAVEFQKAKIIAPGAVGLAEFVKEVRSVQSQYAERGVKLTDAGAVAEVLSMLQEGMTPLFRKRFGDGLVTALRGKDKSAENMKDVRRAVAAIMYSGREAKVELYGGIDAWKAPAPAFEGDPIAMAGAETGEKEAVEPAGATAPEAMPAQGEEAPGAEVVAPDAESGVKPPAAKSPEAEAAAKEIKAAFEQKQKAKTAPENIEIAPTPEPAEDDVAPIEPTPDAGRGEAEKPKETHSEQKERPRLHSLEWFIGTGMSPEAAQKAYEGERGQGKTEVVSPKPTYLSLGDSSFSKAMMGESMGGNAGPNRIALNFLHDGEGVVFWGNFQDSKPEIRKRYDAGELKDGTLLLEFAKGDFSHPKVVDVFGELPPTLANVKDTIIDLTRPSAPTPTVTLDGGTPAEIDAEKAKVEAQRKKQEERDEIAKKAAAPLKGDMGDTTPPLPDMEGVAPDDLELLNQKPKEAQNADQERGAKEVAGGKQARGAEADGGGDAQGSKATGTAGKPEGEGLQERAVEVAPTVAKMSAEVEFDAVPKKGQYAEIPGVSTAQGKRMYLIQGKWGDGQKFHVSATHHGKVLTGMAVLLRTKGKSEHVGAVRIIGGGKAPEGSEQWGVSEWSSYNQKLVNRHKEGAKAAPKATITPKSDTKPAESPTIEPPKVEAPPAPPAKQKKRFASEAELVAYLDANPEAASWTEEDFEIVADETQPAKEVVAPVSEAPAAPAKAEFVPPLKKIGENNVAYKRRTEALRKEWEAAQAAKGERQAPSTPEPAAVDKHPGFVMVASGVTPSDFEEVLRGYVDRRNVAKGGPEGTTIRRRKSIKGDDAWLKYQNIGAGTVIYDNLNLYVPAEDVGTWNDVAIAAGRRELTTPPLTPPIETKPDAKLTEEEAEMQANRETSARVDAIPDDVYIDNPALAVMDVELPAYEARKVSSTRTADSKERQAYSTPPPLAAIGAAALAGARGGNAAPVTVTDPTAGNGGLLVVLRLSKGDKVLANELDEGRAARLSELFPDVGVTQGDYAAETYQRAVADAAKDGPRAFLMNPPFGPTDESGYKLEHRVALKTIESAVPGDTLFFIGAAPGRNAMKMLPGALAGAYTSGAFGKFHQELNRRGWKPSLHFIADGALYRKMGASFPVEVLLMEKTDGKEQNLHMPMRNLPARYSTWEQIRAAVAEMYEPGAMTIGERVAAGLEANADVARAEAQGNAEASSPEVNAARENDGTADAPRYRLSQDIELGLVTPETGLIVSPVIVRTVYGKVWDKEFAGIVHNPTQLAERILTLPPEIAEARIRTADAIVAHLRTNPANGFNVSPDYVSMGPAMRGAFEARWNAERPSGMEEAGGRAQVEYSPLSTVEVASPMKVPIELAGGIARALNDFADRHPEGIDAFVAEKMGWSLGQTKDGRLDGSQIDALGLAIEKIDEGTGMIVGSQTGAGKGRVMGSVMDYHRKQGRVPIFLTAQAKLFTDIWRDLTATGAADDFKPLVLNDYKAPKNEDPDSEDADAFSMPVFFTPVQRGSALSEGKLPQGANAIFLTYSQVQNPTASTRRKIDLIKTLLASGKGALVMDEAHLAAGADSNRGAVLREFADLAKPGVVFSSATFAKRGENMTLYKRAGYSQFFKNDMEMEQALLVGGVPFQQYLAARLTERGFYVRHELDYENVVFEKLTTIDTLGTPQERTALSQREEQIADVFNQAVRTVMRFGAMVKAVNSRLQKGAPSANMDGAAFMSSLHNTASFIYTALKAETVANAAVAELRAGRAPVVTLYNTNQALLTEIGLNQAADVGRYLTRIAERAVAIQLPDGSSASILTPVGFGELVRLVKTQDATMLRDAADALVREARSAAEYLREQNLPASPIDRVREIVENAGYQFGEVTGRTLMVRNGVVTRRAKPNPDTVIRQFNQGAPDGGPNMVLLLNTSGSTGLSAHASRDFRNQARRVMFVLQPSWDINDMMQMFGRVNRKNQLSKPIYHLVFTSAAGEQRNAAILMSKLRSLSANTSGVSKAGYGETVEDALDFMNAFGDKALAELAAERNPVVASINALRASTSIRSATSISQFLPVREQEEFISQIQAKVAALQDNAREAGLHDLEAGDIGRVPLTVEQLLSNSAMRAYEVPVLGRGKILTASEAVAAAQAWQAKHPTMLDDAKAKIDKAIAGTSNPWLQRIYGNTAQVLEQALDSIGQVYYVRDDVGGGRRWFVPMEVRLPPSGTAQTASDWRVKVSFNTIRGVTTIPLSIFADKILSNAAKSSERNYNDTLTRKEDRTIIAGDVAKALIGNIVATGASGASQIVRALPVDGNFSSFVLMMPRGVTVANAKKIASSKLVTLTDVKDIRVGQNGYLGIDADRVKVTPTYSSTTGDQIGAVFAFRIATPNKSRSKDVTVAQLMRAAGAESRLRDTPNSQGYVTGPYLGVDEANTALKNLAALHPALQATQIVSDEGRVGGQATTAADAPRYRLPGVTLDTEPVFFSQLRRTLEAKMPNRMTVMALRGLIDPSRSGVKADEIEWTGLREFLDGKNPGDYVTKAEVLEAAKDVDIQEVVKGQTQAELESQEELTALARLGRDRTPEQDARYEQLARRLRIGKDLDNATKFEQYQLPGGENYRELLLTLPEPKVARGKDAEAVNERLMALVDQHGAIQDMPPDARAEAERLSSEYYRLVDAPEEQAFRSSHFSEPNILAHVRFNERQAANGDKTLFLEEVQSDWHQAGREQGYANKGKIVKVTPIPADSPMRTIWRNKYTFENGVVVGANSEAEAFAEFSIENNSSSKVPDAPFKDTSKGWARLAFKRMLRWAAENGFDRIAWTTGEMQAERYDLSKQVKSVSWVRDAENDRIVTIAPSAGNDIEFRVLPTGMVTGVGRMGSGTQFDGKHISDVIGKEIGAKILADTHGDMRGLDLKVGGEGMRTFYDQILPSIANDIGKKFGARVEDVGIKLPNINVHSLPVTPAMRESVMQGQPRFRLPGVKLDAEEIAKRDAAYMAAVEAGDRGGDNLVELLRKTEKDERDKAVAAWLERNPETAKRLEKMVVDRARAAGYKHGHLWHASAEAFNVFRRRFERDRLKSAAEAEKIQRFGKGIFFTSNESVARNFGDINRRFFLKIDDLQEANLGGFDYYEGKGYDPETGEPWLSDNGEHLRVDKSRLPDEMAEAHLDDSGTRNTGVVVRGVYESIPSAGNPKPLADTWVVGNPSQIKSADSVTYDAAGRIIPPSERFNEASDDIRYRLPGVTLDDISAPVRVGGLRTQAQLENEDPVGFPILDHIRGGNRIVIPRGDIGRKGEYDWFTEAGGLKAFNLTEQRAFFRHPKGGEKNHGNIDTLAKELETQLGTDDVETFVDAFLAEVDRSRALYQEQKERQTRRRSALEAVSEHGMFKGKANIGETMGRAIGSVFDAMTGEDKITLQMIWEREGLEAARDYILMNHFEKVVMDMDEHYAFIEGRYETPAIIEDRSLSVEVATGENGETRSVYAQNKETLRILAARLYTSNPEGVAKITDEDAAAFVREALDVGGPEFLREQAEKMVAERLTGQRDTPLNKNETAVMLWYQTDLDARTKEQDGEAEKAASTNNISALNLADMERDNIHRATLDYLNAARQYGSLAGQALQALKLRVDHAFNIVKIYRQAFEDNGNISLTPQQYAALKARVAALEKKWNDYVGVASLSEGEAELDARVVELEKLLADATTNRDSLKATVGQLETKKTALESEYAEQSATATQLSEQKAQLEAQIAGLENEIAMREALNQEVGALQAKVDALQAKLDALDAEYAGASPELLASLEKRLADLTALYNRKLADYRRAEEDLKAANDRLKRVQKLIAKLGTTAKAKIARRRVVLTEASNLYGAFKEEMEAAQVERLKNRWRGANPAGKALMAIAVTRDMIRALQSMADESVAGRQLAKLGLAHPILWRRAWAQSQRLVFSRSGELGEDGHLLTWAERSDRRLFEIDQMMREHPMFDVLVRKGGLSWMDLTADPSSFDEQQTPVGPLLRTMLPSKFTRGYTSLLEVSNNHYAGMSNMLRFAAACQLYEKMNVAKGETPTAEDIDAIISTVDIFGGRGNLSSERAKSFVKFAGHFLYSPRLAISNVQFFKRMAGFAIDPSTSGRAKAMIATEYLRLGASYAVISVLFRLVSKMFSDDPDEQRFQFRPGHSAFLTLMRGQRRFDFTGGAAMWARSVSQILGFGDKLDTETGLVTQEWANRQNLDWNAVGRLVRSKMDPWTGMMTDLVAGKTYRGQAAGPRAKANSPDYAWRYPNLVSSIAPVPLSFQSLADMLRGDTEQGIAPLRNPLFILEAVGAQIIGTGANSLPVNAELAQEVAEGYTRNAEELKTLNNRLDRVLSDRKMSPELKELRAQRVQDKIDRLRGL